MAPKHNYGAAQKSGALLVNIANDGGLYIADTDTHLGDWTSILATTAAVAALVSDNLTGTLTSVNIAAGVEIKGHFTSIKLASGTVIAYA
jgi:hypothetical protein